MYYQCKMPFYIALFFSTEHFILQFLKMPSLLEHTCMPSQSTVGVVPIIWTLLIWCFATLSMCGNRPVTSTMNHYSPKRRIKTKFSGLTSISMNRPFKHLFVNSGKTELFFLKKRGENGTYLFSKKKNKRSEDELCSLVQSFPLSLIPALYRFCWSEKFSLSTTMMHCSNFTFIKNTLAMNTVFSGF